MNPWILLPSTIIMFREVFVSGLREFLGATAGLLKVTKLAKWKTTAQMVAIAVLFAQGVFEHHLGMSTWGMDQRTFDGIMAGLQEDVLGLRFMYWGAYLTWLAGVALLCIAAVLTLVTGFDYFRKALPYLRDEVKIMIDVLYFAWVRERIGLPKEQIEASGTVMDLVETLKAREDRYALAFSDLGALLVWRSIRN